MSSGLIEISHCEVCGNENLSQVLDLGLHPMCDDLVEVDSQRVCKDYPIEILFCDKCLTAHQRFQIPKQELFPKTYHYRSRHTKDVLNGMRDLVEACQSKLGNLSRKTVLDIGCNDGSLLSIFSEFGCETIGVEPTGAAADASSSGQHKVINDFFSESVAENIAGKYGVPDIITFTNVFAHIEDLKGLLGALKKVMGPETMLVIENHYLGAIVEKDQFDTFYHEHPRTYSATSFKYIAESLQMTLGKIEFPKRYGGNIRVFIKSKNAANTNHEAVGRICENEAQFAQGIRELSSRIELWKNNKLKEIENEIDQHGKLSAKAFPGRAAIAIRLLSLDENHISQVYEKPGSGKIGHFVPGTRIPILSDDEFSQDLSAPIINLAWHISGEITSYMRSRGYEGKIIDILSKDDFA